jgi:hypothetical protein
MIGAYRFSESYFHLSTLFIFARGRRCFLSVRRLFYSRLWSIWFLVTDGVGGTIYVIYGQDGQLQSYLLIANNTIPLSLYFGYNASGALRLTQRSADNFSSSLTIDTLRTYDTRWGYNGKRGNTHDPSKDVIAYHYGPGPDEGSPDVYIIDIIGGHCGSTPSPIWNDVTAITLQSGTIGKWTSRGRF